MMYKIANNLFTPNPDCIPKIYKGYDAICCHWLLKCVLFYFCLKVLQ